MERKSEIVKQECTFIRGTYDGNSLLLSQGYRIYQIGKSKPRWQSCRFSQTKEPYWKGRNHVRNEQEEIAKNIQMQKGNRLNTYTLCKSNQSLVLLSKNDISFTKISRYSDLPNNRAANLIIFSEILLPTFPFQDYHFRDFLFKL